MIVSTGPSASLRASMGVSGMKSEVGAVSNVRRTVFIELRERGAEGFVAKSEIALQKTIGRTPYNRRMYQGTRRQEFRVLSDIAIGDFVEIFFTRETSKVSLKKATNENILTPYTISYNKKNESEIVLELPSLITSTTLDRRQMFAENVYNLATTTKEPMYKIAALKAMEQLFIAMVSVNKIPYSIAERQFRKYDALQSRMWRSPYPGEQTSSFNLSWNLLAKVTNLKPSQ